MDLKKINIYVQSVFYTLAGLNHFINPEFYYPLIPDYFVFPVRINFIAGVFEILLGVGLLIPLLRKASAYGIILMLVAFIPSHVFFIQQGSCIADSLCVPEWVGWGRLVVIHPLLIYWAWTVMRGRKLTVDDQDFQGIGEAITKSKKVDSNAPSNIK
ncbi:hypothetical protein [Ekhidna sp.]|uniref:DoxX family protein n=1 Tax=Ekhidna sp. TaxID=2608089 RepID=UPI003B503FC2